MSERDQVEILKAALLERGQRLAHEYLAEGRRRRQTILKEAEELVNRHEDREKLRAKGLAERLFRQQVQAGELRAQKELDQLRWSLVQAVLGKVRDRLEQLTADEANYLPVLEQLVKQGAEAIERDKLTARLNARDMERLKLRWEARTQNLVAEKTIELSGDSLGCLGGVLVQSDDERIRVDNTFEGRMERLRESLRELIEEHLFEAGEPTEVSSHG